MSFQGVLGSKVYVPMGGVYNAREVIATAGAEDRFSAQIPQGIFGGQVVGAFRRPEEGGETPTVVLQLLHRDPASSVLVWMMEFLLVMVTLRVAFLVAKRFWVLASILVDFVFGKDTFGGLTKRCWICGHRDITLNISNTTSDEPIDNTATDIDREDKLRKRSVPPHDNRLDVIIPHVTKDKAAERIKADDFEAGTEESLTDTSGSITSQSGTSWSRSESVTREQDSARSSGDTSKRFSDSELDATDTDYCINKWMNSEPQPIQGPRRQAYLRKLAKSLLAIAKYIEKRDEVFHLCPSEAPWAEKLNNSSTKAEAPCYSESNDQGNNGVEKMRGKEPTGGFIKMGFWRVADDMEFPSGLKYEPPPPIVVDKRASSEDCTSLSFLECAAKAGLYTPGVNGKKGALRPCHTEWDKRIRSNQLKQLFQARSKHRGDMKVKVTESAPAIKGERSHQYHAKQTGGDEGNMTIRQKTKGNRHKRTMSVDELENALKRVEAERLYLENYFKVSDCQKITSSYRAGKICQVDNRREARKHSESAGSGSQNKSGNSVLMQGALKQKDDSYRELDGDPDNKLSGDTDSDIYSNLNSSLSNNVNDGLCKNGNTITSDLASDRSYDSSVQAYVLDKFFSSKQLWDERCERQDNDGYLSELSGYLSENGSGRSVILERFLELNRQQLVTEVPDSPENPPYRNKQLEGLETSYATNLLNSCVGDWTLST